MVLPVRTSRGLLVLFLICCLICCLRTFVSRVSPCCPPPRLVWLCLWFCKAMFPPPVTAHFAVPASCRWTILKAPKGGEFAYIDATQRNPKRYIFACQNAHWQAGYSHTLPPPCTAQHVAPTLTECVIPGQLQAHYIPESGFWVPPARIIWQKQCNSYMAKLRTWGTSCGTTSWCQTTTVGTVFRAIIMRNPKVCVHNLATPGLKLPGWKPIH